MFKISEICLNIEVYISHIISVLYLVAMNIFDWIREEQLSRDEILDHYDEC